MRQRWRVCRSVSWGVIGGVAGRASVYGRALWVFVHHPPMPSKSLRDWLPVSGGVTPAHPPSGAPPQWEEHVLQLCWRVGVKGAFYCASKGQSRSCVGCVRLWGPARMAGVGALPPPDTPLAASGQVRVLQRGRQRKGPDQPAHGGGGRALRDAEAGGHHHRAHIREHRCVLG